MEIVAISQRPTSNNRSAEEYQMRDALIPWGRARWPGARMLEELQVGGCRVDLAFVQSGHIAAIEIKSSADTLDRLDRQIEHFTAAIPEVWVAVAPKWSSHLSDLPWRLGHLIVENGIVSEKIKHPRCELRHPAHIDRTMTVPMLHLCHRAELVNIARANSVSHTARARIRDLIELLARKLTGDQIISGCCEQLRARERGWPGDESIASCPSSLIPPHYHHQTTT